MKSWIQRSLWERFTPYTREVPAKGDHVVQGVKADALRQTIALNKREYSTLPIFSHTDTSHTTNGFSFGWARFPLQIFLPILLNLVSVLPSQRRRSNPTRKQSE